MNKRALLDWLMPLPEPRERKGRLVTNNPLHKPCAPAGWLCIMEQRDYDDDSLVDRVKERWERASESRAKAMQRALWEHECEERWFRDASHDPALRAAHKQNIADRRHTPRFYRSLAARALDPRPEP
ncbi:hypothetical protein pkur_cds_622 [Pandoravirus kuranda]|uniref:Uncharacterized protein n=1 Tax=Pandoravirus kuranda TaxID=3019033 RepID=A0AA95ED22_9VIRU|nr:hypothetical protein pkur_cds_622 [Pandoravirus kuranda]